jgi:hypothetical protein
MGRSAGKESAVVCATPAAVQWWFTALDQRVVAVGAERWMAQVVGIHVDGPDLWIQLAAAGDPSRSAVLHVTAGMRLAAESASVESPATSHGYEWMAQLADSGLPLRLPMRAQPLNVLRTVGQ